ncbi:MAG: AAA family ATPase [Dehalococcoidales bacterium]|nr:AAA family ATPase [Dehalococcoidales bacterium]
MSSNFDQFLEHFSIAKRQGNKAICLCPTHDDKHGSLHFTLDRDKILGYCFAGCQIADILTAVNLKLSDLFLDGRRSPEAIYQYQAKDGGLAYEKEKYRKKNGGKTFKQRRLDAEGKIIYDLKDIQRIPYNYPGVIKAIKQGETIIWPEGEKDAETARILGYAHTTMGGASDWKDEWKGFFRNARVALFSDKDKPGISLVQNISKSLVEVSKSVKVVILPDGKDLSEWVTLGHGRADLDKLIAEAPELVKSKRFDLQDFAISHDDLLAKELEPLDYLVDGILTTPGTAVLAGRKKIGKSWLSLQLSQSVASGSPFLGKATRQGGVIHLALEDGERRLKQRLEMQNAAKKLPVTYITQAEPLNTTAGFEALQELIRVKHPALVVIDTFATAKNRFLVENEAGSNADLFNKLHSVAIAENTVIVLVAHHGKASYGDPGFDIRGSSAIPGATDTNLGLYKNSDGTFDLKAEGRDIGEVDLRISFDAELTWRWQCQGDARDVRRAEAEDRILDALNLLGGEAEASVIANEIDVTRATVSTHLKRMREQGIVGYKVFNTGKTSKIIYLSPTVPTNPTHQTEGDGITVGTEGIVGATKKELPMTDSDIPDYPAAPCGCGCRDYWLREASQWGKAEWLCSRCHPQRAQ